VSRRIVRARRVAGGSSWQWRRQVRRWPFLAARPWSQGDRCDPTNDAEHTGEGVAPVPPDSDPPQAPVDVHPSVKRDP